MIASDSVQWDYRSADESTPGHVQAQRERRRDVSHAALLFFGLW